jgi:uncharacterized protein (DUF4415 family)
MTTTKKNQKADRPLGKIINAVAPADDDDDIPPLGDAFWSKAQMGSPLKKQLMSLRLDNDVVEWFRAQGPNYQTRINQVLRTYVEYSKREEASNK